MGRAVYLDLLWQAEQAIAAGCWQCFPVATPSRLPDPDAVLAEVVISSSSLCLPSSAMC
ncbi:MAG: hypothetical protein R2874_15530 [Desulfobacterales bacterium]